MWLWAGAAVAATFTVDLGALQATRGAAPISSLAPLCERGGDRVLGVAAVFYTKRPVASAWGHNSTRVLACRDGALSDIEYELYRLAGWNMEVARQHAGGTEAWWASQRGRLFVFRNEQPVDAGYYGNTSAWNRGIYEVWLDAHADELEAMASALEGAWVDQERRIEAGERLERGYEPIGHNCTWGTRIALAELDLTGPRRINRTVLPFQLLRRIERRDRIGLAVFYPSEHLVVTSGLEHGLLVQRQQSARRIQRIGPALGEELRAQVEAGGSVVADWLRASEPPS